MPDLIAPLRPAGPLVSILGSTGNTGAGTLINMPGDFSIRAFNRSPATDAYLAYGPNSTVVAGATLPVVGVGVPANGIGANLLPLPFHTAPTFSFSGPTFFAVIIPGTGNAIVDLIPGDG